MATLGGLESLPYQGLGLGGIVALLALLLFTGRIVVKYVYDDMVKQRDYWRDKYSQGEDVRRELVSQNGVLLEAVAKHAHNDEITVQLLTSIRDESRRVRAGEST